MLKGLFQNEGKLVFVSFTFLLAMTFFFYAIGFDVPYLGNVGSAGIVFLFLFIPDEISRRRKTPLRDYGVRWDPLLKSLLLAFAVMAVLFPLFVIANEWFVNQVCGDAWLRSKIPVMCSRGEPHWPELPLKTFWADIVAVNFLVIALPEELLFRGCYLTLLEMVFPPKRRLLGGGIGLALVISAVLFGLIHIPRGGPLHALATFFPGLVFGWLYSATRSLVAPIIVHAMANILQEVIALVMAPV